MKRSHKKQFTELNEYRTVDMMSEKDMDDIYAKIEASAEEINVPESLEPEAVKAQLRAKKRRFPVRRTVEIAAAVALVVAVGGTGVYGMITRNQDGGVDASAPNEDAAPASNDSDGGVAGVEENARQVSVEKTKNVGNYHLASGYDEVYELFEKQKKAMDYSVYYNEYDTGDIIFDGEMVSGAESDIWSLDDANVWDADEVKEENASIASGSGQQNDYSKTNLQVEGVDESDFIKNDGNYLYVQTNDQVSVIDIREKQMKELAVITPKLEAAEEICDMYVDDTQLYLIVQKDEDKLVDVKDEALFWDEESKESCTDSYYVSASRAVELQTYDISDRANVQYLGAVTQDGGYYSSRKVGDYIYLFSRKETYDAKIPEVNGVQASCDCIYIQDRAASELIIASVNTKEPETVVDHMVLMNNYAQIYMGTEAIYLYSDNYEWNEAAQEGSSRTDIAKFSYDNGMLNGVAATVVQGTIQDVFAISESNGTLRVLTTEWKSASTNQLYLLDEKLELLGKLKDIAVGEEIYAARYIGNTAYFITYHNTDPLFAVDISDPSDPKMLGQVKITGFSDYLHPYGDGLLLGIGYETDPDTSERLGVKLVMFDISDPKELKILDSVVLDGDSCNAANDYKSALVSTSRNLIGFATADWSNECERRYLLYSWDGSKFVKQFSDTVDSKCCWDDTKIRGLYAGEQFYLVNQKKGGYLVRSYDMADDYQALDELVVK